MRLKAEFWIKAYLRTCQRQGAFGAIVAHGDDDAGAVYIKINRLDGSAMLFGPAPAGFDASNDDRAFVAMSGDGFKPEAEVDAIVARQRDFDSDLWLVEIEDRQGRHFLDGWLMR